MRIYFTKVSRYKFAIKHILEGDLKYLGQPVRQVEMSLSVVSPEEIRLLNKQYRDFDSVTDVLSFPTMDNPERQVLNLADCPQDLINSATGKVNVGDVLICAERAQEQATNYGHSFKREICFLALHGLLHLLGYDHIEPADDAQMTALQEEILTKLHIGRDIK